MNIEHIKVVLLIMICILNFIIVWLLGSISVSFERDYTNRITAINHNQYDVMAHGSVYLPEDVK